MLQRALHQACLVSAACWPSASSPSSQVAASLFSRHGISSSTDAGRPYSSTSLSNSELTAADDARKKALASKLLYRSKQRGFLELDLLVGLWAEQEVPRMGLEQLQQLQAVLDQENPDLFKWLTGQLPAPGNMLANPVFMSLRQAAAKQLEQCSVSRSRAAPGKDWVRGWDDGWRQGQQPNQGTGTADRAQTQIT